MTFTILPHSVLVVALVHSDMQKLFNTAVPDAPFQIIAMQGMRTREEELNLWLHCHNPDGSRNGHPWLTNCNGTPVGETSPEGYAGTGVSRHQSGHALDIGVMVAGKMVWDSPHYKAMQDHMQLVADRLGIKIVLGATFHTPDPDHVELDPDVYPV
jgi:hypothetical protein